MVMNWAAIVPRMEAPARALVATPWLDDPAFVRQCIVVLDDDPPSAAVDWVAVCGYLERHRDDGCPAVAALRAAARAGRDALR
jgi:hypothetical protein